MNNYIALILTFAFSVIFLRLMNFIAQRGWMDSKLSRKVIHIGTGPLFVLCWLMFSDMANGRWLAALVPLVITIQFALVGFGIIKDPAAVQSMSRTGDPKEILRGPLYYGIMFVALTLIYWKDSLIGIPALMMMCGGDGIADIVGRRISSPRLPWSREKSLAGLLSVFVGGWLLTMLVFAVYVWIGAFSGPMTRFLIPVTIIALVAAFAESLPLKDIDNITVTVAAVIAGWLVF
jgi:phytol kinase